MCDCLGGDLPTLCSLIETFQTSLDFETIMEKPPLKNIEVASTALSIQFVCSILTAISTDTVNQIVSVKNLVR